MDPGGSPWWILVDPCDGFWLLQVVGAGRSTGWILFNPHDWPWWILVDTAWSMRRLLMDPCVGSCWIPVVNQDNPIGVSSWILVDPSDSYWQIPVVDPNKSWWIHLVDLGGYKWWLSVEPHGASWWIHIGVVGVPKWIKTGLHFLIYCLLKLQISWLIDIFCYVFINTQT